MMMTITTVVFFTGVMMMTIIIIMMMSTKHHERTRIRGGEFDSRRLHPLPEFGEFAGYDTLRGGDEGGHGLS